MNIRVINMAGATERMTFQAAQLTRLGLAYSRVEAVTPDTLSPPPDDPAWTAWERPLRDVEKALYASHRRVWAMIAAEDAPCLVLEDDAMLSARVPALLAALEGAGGIDHISLETRSRYKYVGKVAHPDLPLRRLYQDRTGAAAYVLWPEGARILLGRPAGLADAVICAAYDLRSYQADPALAIQVDQCGAYGLAPPIAVTSGPGSQPKPTLATYPAAQRAGFRMRRVAAQFRAALRLVTTYPRATRKAVTPAPDMLS